MRARATDPETSQRHVPTLERQTRRDKVIKALTEHGPLNSKELAEITGIDRVSVSPLLKPMERDGDLECTDIKRDKGLLWQLKTKQQQLF